MSSPAMKRRRYKRRLRESLEPISGGMTFYYDRKGRHVPSWRWVWLGMDRRYRFVGNTYVGSARVSTIWTGIDAGFDFGLHEAGARIFETAILRPNEEIEIVGQWVSEEQALSMHAETVAGVS